MSQTTETFEDRILPMLVQAVPSHRRRTRLRRGGFGVVVLVAALALIVPSLGAALGTDTIRVSAQDAVRDPAAVEQNLREAGINATVIVVPMPPNWKVLDQTWLWLHFDEPSRLSQNDFANIYRQVGEGLAGLTDEQMDRGNGIAHMQDLELPHDLPGHVTLFAVASNDDQVPSGTFDYDWTNELSPVGTFWCAHLDPNDPLAVGEAVGARGYDITWTLEPEDNGAATESVAVPPAGTVVTWAWLTGPHSIDIRLMREGALASRLQHQEGTLRPGQDASWAPPCSPGG